MTYLLAILGALMTINTTIEAREITQDEVESAAKALVDTKQIVGISIAVIQPSGTFLKQAGRVSLGSEQEITGATIFEIGSVTKAITGLALAGALLQKSADIREQDEVERHLPNFVIPQWQSKKPTIGQLATHRSGLPQAFDEVFAPADPLNPWANFTTDELKAFLLRTSLISEPGSEFKYSNIGAGLIGHVLEGIYGQDFEEIVTQRIFSPLEMTDSGITLNSEQSERLIRGYYKDNGNFVPIPNWQIPGIPAAGALRSSANDMTRFGRMLIDSSSAFSPLVEKAIEPRTAGPFPNSYLGLFWIVMPDDGFAWHNGATYGVTSFVGFNRTARVAVIILTNTYTASQEETKLGLELMKSVNSRG